MSELAPARQRPQAQITRDALYIDGGWTPSDGAGAIDVVDPFTEAPFASVPRGTASDVNRAVAAARRALASWSSLPPAERRGHLERIADGLEERSDEVAELVAREVGMPLRLARSIQAGLPIGDFRTAAQAMEELSFEQTVGRSLVIREPVGVVAAITPWNFPLHQVAAKVAGALAAGCTVIVKPSELAPLTSFVLAEVCEGAGLPAGVLNVVTGDAPEVGEALASHPGVDMVSFTGSTRAGRRVSELAAATVKKVALELGGKSPCVALDDADLEKAVAGCVSGCFLNSGQTCNAPTRLLVPEERLGEAEQLAARAAARFTLGDPFDDATRLGPVISAEQRERIRASIAEAIDAGAALVAGGPDVSEAPEHGYFVRPTVLSRVHAGMTVAQEEIFGPVLAILPHAGEEEAIRLANDSVYGLGGAVWSSDPGRAERVARRLRTGQVDINGAPFNPAAPFGGFGQSGHGRELGTFGIDEFSTYKSLQR